MEFVYRGAFLIGITLLVPIIFKYLTAKSKEHSCNSLKAPIE